MLTTLYYFLQVILCSGIMMGYYWLVLRDKKFHQYNRFYLLMTAATAWIVPLIKIQWVPKPTAKVPVYEFLTVIASGNTRIDASLHNRWYQLSWQSALTLFYVIVSAVLLIILLVGIIRVWHLVRTHRITSVGDFFLVLTRTEGTPFSFFSYVFWNEAVDINSNAGKQMLQHEITHVQQKHSFDKLFIQLVIIAGWFNPFFWMLKAEMSMIHEYIADKKSVEQGDTAALAAMLLTAAYPQQQFLLSNPFFFSPIKRRIAMLTNQSNPKFSYIRRLVILPLLAVVVVLFAFRSKELREKQPLSLVGTVTNITTPVINEIKAVVEPIKTDAVKKDTTILSGDSVYIIPSGKEVKIIGSPTFVSPSLNSSLYFKQNANKNTFLSSFSSDVLLMLDGKVVDKQLIESIPTNSIESVRVLKDKKSIEIYGDAGKNGVIQIFTKNRDKLEERKITLDSTRLMSRTQNLKYVVDGVVADGNALKSMDPNLIHSMEIVKDKSAIEAYGDATTDAVVFVITKVRGAKVVQGYRLPDANNTDESIKKYGQIVKDFNAQNTYRSLKVDIGVTGGPTKVTINSKNGTSDTYDLSIETERNTAEKKYPGISDFVMAAHEMDMIAGKNKNQPTNYVKGYPLNSASNQIVIEDVMLSDVPSEYPNMSKVMKEFYKRNPDIKQVSWTHGPLRMLVDLKNGSRETYDLTDANSKALAEKRYGDLPMPAPPPPPPSKKLIEVPLQKGQDYTFVNQKQALNVRTVPKDKPMQEVVVEQKKLEGEMYDKVFTKTEVPASFPGGKSAWDKYLQRNLKKDIPVEKGGPPGKYTVIVSFIVTEDGTIQGVKGENNPGYGTKEEAVRMIMKGPKWKPAQQNGKNVTSRVKQQITFVISEE